MSSIFSSVPNIVFTPAGVVLPSPSDILTGVQADISSAFGGGLNPKLETPQGQLSSSQAAVINDKNSEIAYMVNQIDPQYSDSRWQDAIARIYYLTRKPGTSTAVQCTIIGLTGTIIPAGALAQDTSGNTYACQGAVTIPVSGTVIAQFQNIVNGPIACPVGTLNRIYQTVLGWDTINNLVAGVPGTNIENRAEFELRRQQSVAINSQSTNGTIQGQVLAIPDVIYAYVLDNPTSATVLSGPTNYPLLPHSLYVAAVGGTDTQVAQAIWTHKNPGCDYNGNTSVTVLDTGPAYPSPPYPAYVVKFQRPAALTIKFQVDIVNSIGLPSNISDLIKAAILGRFNGANNTTRERIGGIIYVSNYYSAVAATSNNLTVLDIFVGTTTPNLLLVKIGIDQYPTLTVDNIVVNLV